MFNFLNPEFLINTVGYTGIFSIIFFESGFFFAFFFPGDTLLFSSGFLASQGVLNFTLLLVGFYFATYFGALAGYFFGKKVGDKIFTKKGSFLFDPKNLDRTKIFYAKYGNWTMAFCRFIPFVRTFAPILAGVGKMNLKTFLKYNLIGTLLWPTVVLSAGYFLGSFFPVIHDYVLPAIGIIFLSTLLPVLWAVYKHYLKEILNRKRNKNEHKD